MPALQGQFFPHPAVLSAVVDVIRVYLRFLAVVTQRPGVQPAAPAYGG